MSHLCHSFIFVIVNIVLKSVLCKLRKNIRIFIFFRDCYLLLTCSDYGIMSFARLLDDSWSGAGWQSTCSQPTKVLSTKVFAGCMGVILEQCPCMLWRVIIPNQWGQVDYVSDMRSEMVGGNIYNGCNECEHSSIYGVCRAAMHIDRRLHLCAGGVIGFLPITSVKINNALMNYLREIQSGGALESAVVGLNKGQNCSFFLIFWCSAATY